jgi:predicted XRE-type DNA-binding protein
MPSRNGERAEAVTRGTANVFADLGFPDASERQAKLRLAYALNQVLEERKLSQADAAKVLGVTQPKVSPLTHYKLAGFSVERLMNLLTALDQDVEIVIRRKPCSRKMVGSASSRREPSANATRTNERSSTTQIVYSRAAARSCLTPKRA